MYTFYIPFEDILNEKEKVLAINCHKNPFAAFEPTFLWKLYSYL